MSTAVAIQRVRELVEMESRGHGDTENAMRRLESQLGVGFWTIWHLYQRRAKRASGELCERIQWGYFNYIERKAGKLNAVLDTIEATTDDDLETLQAQLADLAEKIAAKKAVLAARRVAKP